MIRVENGKFTAAENPETVRKWIKLLNPEPEQKLKGMGIGRGSVRSRARIILDEKHIDKFRKGEILVTNMTNPAFLPAMRKASAIITDEGGITCHAAIVSRELGIPAVVGTMNATEIIHDGQMVEVDAENGIVRLISEL